METTAGTAWIEKATGRVWAEDTPTDARGRHRLVHRSVLRPGVTVEDWHILADAQLADLFDAAPAAPGRAVGEGLRDAA